MDCHPSHSTHSCECTGDSDPSARRISLLGTTEQRIVFSPVEIRNPAASTSTPASRSTSKAKTSGKESTSNLKKGKKKANVGAGSIEEVAGSLSVGVSKPPALVDLSPTVEPGPTTRSKAVGKKRDDVAQDDNDVDMYAAEDGDDAEEGGGDGTLKENADGEEDVGEETAGLPPREKRKHLRDGEDEREESTHHSTEGPTATTTPKTVSGPNISRGQHQQGTPPTVSDIPVAIDPALEAFQVPTNQPSPQLPGSGTRI